MKVLLVSTSEQSGGGAIAARRLMEALRQNGVEARMMVRDKQSDDKAVVKVGCKLPKLLERLDILPYVSRIEGKRGDFRTRLWQPDTASEGIRITRTREFREADVIHLHWVNQGMLSLHEIGRILSSGKRVVWTLHDEWPYLGVCHYRGRCEQLECRFCPVMSGVLPFYIRKRKHELYQAWRPTFVGCSQWITRQAHYAMPRQRVVHINNCIPSALFHPTDMQQARRALSLPPTGRLLLFCSQKVTDERKGIAFLAEALGFLATDNVHLVIVGKGSEHIPLPDGITATRLGTVCESRMPLVYSAVDAFLTPSLQDNLPNTIAEAMSCGTPCVGFDVGGISEMIDHKENGYVARYRDAVDLAEGIRYVLARDLRQAAHAKAACAYDEASVARQYIDLYRE